jgi:hypothetical protein
MKPDPSIEQTPYGRRRRLNRPIFVSIAMLAAACNAAPRELLNACYVRAEAFAASAPESAEARVTQSHVGVRRKTEQLFELDVSVSGPGDATCSLTGLAKLRGEPGQEALAMVVRPDPTRKTGRTGTLCQVFVHLTADAVELRTTPTSCQAQSLCEGKVELNGQRFESATKVPTGTPGPCFDRRAP